MVWVTTQHVLRTIKEDLNTILKILLTINLNKLVTFLNMFRCPISNYLKSIDQYFIESINTNSKLNCLLLLVESILFWLKYHP